MVYNSPLFSLHDPTFLMFMPVISDNSPVVGFNTSFFTSTTELWTYPSSVTQFNLEFRHAVDVFLSDLGYNVSVANVSAALNSSENTLIVTVNFSLVFAKDEDQDTMLQAVQE